MSGANEAEWKQLSAQWRESLTKLLDTLDTVNKNRAEVERQKEMLRVALTQGRFDMIDRERALALYGKWNRGIQMVPLYPEDYAQKQPESVYLSPLAGPDGPANVGPNGPNGPLQGPSAYLYEIDEGLLAYKQPRDWIHVAPPQIVSTASVPTTIELPAQPYYPVTAIAGWRVRRIGEGETLSFEDARAIVMERDGEKDQVKDQEKESSQNAEVRRRTIEAANAIAQTASRIARINQQQPQPISAAPQPQVFVAPQTPDVVMVGPNLVGPNVVAARPILASRVVTPGILAPLRGYAEPAVEMTVVEPPSQFMAPVPMVAPWRARQQRAAIARQRQRIFTQQEVLGAYTPAPPDAPDEDDQ